MIVHRSTGICYPVFGRLLEINYKANRRIEHLKHERKTKPPDPFSLPLLYRSHPPHKRPAGG